MKKPDGGQMFSRPVVMEGSSNAIVDNGEFGASYRKWLAGLAMQALIPKYWILNITDGELDRMLERIARASYMQADAMIAEGEKG